MECDNKTDIALFESIIRKLSLSYYMWFPHSVEVAKKAIQDPKLKKYINRYTLYYLKSLRYNYLFHLNYRNIKDFKRQVRYIDYKDWLRQNIERHNRTAPPNIDFEDFAVKFFSDLFKQKLKEEDYKVITKILHKILCD